MAVSDPITLLVTNQLPLAAHECFESFLAIHPIPSQARFAADTALEEWMQNIVDYSRAGHVILTFELSSSEFIMRIVDDGTPFNPLQSPAPDLTIPVEQREVGGLGVYMMRKMMDEATYLYSGDGNTLVLTKKLS